MLVSPFVRLRSLKRYKNKKLRLNKLFKIFFYSTTFINKVSRFYRRRRFRKILKKLRRKFISLILVWKRIIRKLRKRRKLRKKKKKKKIQFKRPQVKKFFYKNKAWKRPSFFQHRRSYVSVSNTFFLAELAEYFLIDPSYYVVWLW